LKTDLLIKRNIYPQYQLISIFCFVKSWGTSNPLGIAILCDTIETEGHCAEIIDTNTMTTKIKIIADDQHIKLSTNNKGNTLLEENEYY
jgi:hypothetical protein